MKHAIKAVMFANGASCPHAGQYVKSADFNAHDGRGFVDFTPDISKALLFNNIEDALEFWRTPSTVKPLREDGEPNRPLTSLTAQIVPLDED